MRQWVHLLIGILSIPCLTKATMDEKPVGALAVSKKPSNKLKSNINLLASELDISSKSYDEDQPQGSTINIGSNETLNPETDNTVNFGLINNSIILNAHTITAQDFANKVESILPNNELLYSKPDLTETDSEKHSSSSEPIIINSKPLNKSMLTIENIYINDKSNILPDIGLNITEYLPHAKNKEKFPKDNSAFPTISDGLASKEPQSERVIKVLNEVSDQIKSYSNSAVISWEETKEKVSKETESTHVLEDYLEKITISQKANNTECVKKDMEKYKERKKRLEEILSVCEKEIKRDYWNKLQNTTKEELQKISSILLTTDNNTGDNMKATTKDTYNLNSETKEYNFGKENFQVILDSLLFLKERALKEDEREYSACVIVKTKDEIVVETLSDIMKIKNNCVG